MPVVWEVDMTDKDIKKLVSELGLWVIVLGDMIEDLQEEIRKMRKKGRKVK